ncbi:MAG: tetratricopeptide repeat protein [Flavobacteriaceae bacterium]|nr:tetratricopeptide repeat protein [Bacteroidia bacterium]NNK86802.1 tetratricopeptide repeat protein [Flavobacteriaceae bacterium]
MRSILSISLIVCSLQLSAQSGIEAFYAGNSAYNEGRYQDAIQLYESILDADLHSAELYFNLGNCYYKTNQVAPSIFYYEKALQLDPKDADIQNNLAFAQNMTIDAIDTVPEIGISKVYSSIVESFSYDTWAILAVTLMLLFVLLFLMYYFSVSTNKKRFLFLGSFVSLALSLCVLTFAFQRFDSEKRDNPAIVFAQESEVRSDPNLRSEIVFNLHEGTKIQVLEAYDENWYKIRLSDGKTGWISIEDIKLLNVF